MSKNRITLEKFQSNPFRLRKPLTNPEGFYRHYVELIDDPKTLDRMTSMLCSICKFARYEYRGIKGAGDVVPDRAHSISIEDKISCVHLAEETCTVRLFDELLKNRGLELVEWKLEWPNRAWVGRSRFRKNVDDRVQTLRHSSETPASTISAKCLTRTARNWLCFLITTPPTES